jgi:peptidoglycan/xylan/chitin deacetylase (PgdA/CDA1 family)
MELVLTFHGIGPAPARVPEAEWPYWMPEDDFEEFVADAGTKARRLGISLVATFDDGNRSDRYVVAPLLVRHGIRGIFFPCTGRIGDRDYLDAGDIRALDREGFEIGSHGIDHLPWSSLVGDALAREVGHSKATLQNILGHDVGSAAIPFGSYNRRVLAALRAADYARIYSSDTGLSREDRWFRRRWSYRAGRPFDISQMVAISGTVRHRLLSASKGLLKSLR